MLRTGQDLAARYQRGHIEKARTGLEQVNTFADKTDCKTWKSTLQIEQRRCVTGRRLGYFLRVLA